MRKISKCVTVHMAEDLPRSTAKQGDCNLIINISTASSLSGQWNKEASKSQIAFHLFAGKMAILSFDNPMIPIMPFNRSVHAATCDQRLSSGTKSVGTEKATALAPAKP